MIEKMLSAYKKIYSKEFIMKNPDDVLNIQRCNYILAMSGMRFPKSYKYILCDYGPYSPELSYDLKKYYKIDRKIEYRFDKTEEKILESLKKLISDISSKCSYTDMEIVEAKASLLFIEELEICSAKTEALLNELHHRKPRLNKFKINGEILQYSL